MKQHIGGEKRRGGHRGGDVSAADRANQQNQPNGDGHREERGVPIKTDWRAKAFHPKAENRKRKENCNRDRREDSEDFAETSFAPGFEEPEDAHSESRLGFDDEEKQSDLRREDEAEERKPIYICVEEAMHDRRREDEESRYPRGCA